MVQKLTPRQAIARSYPGWDYAMADRLLAWLDHCGYEIVEKSRAYKEASLVPGETSGETSPHTESSH